MKGWSHLAIVAVLLGAAVLASAQEQRIYAIPEDTQCWDCHAPGLWDPDMDPNFDIFASFQNVTVGETFEFQAELVNIWKAEQIDMFVTLDISNATSLRFLGGKDPEASTATGTIRVDPTGIGPFDVVTAAEREFTDRQRVIVPNGATDLRISLIPEDRSENTGPDLSLRLYDKFATEKLGDNRPPRPIEVENAGKGGTEVFHVPDASRVAGHGFGNWTIETMYKAVRGSGTGSVPDPQSTEIPYTIRVEAWFNVTGQSLAIVNKPGPVQPGGIEIFTWELTSVAPPKPGEDVLLIANVTTYYEHQSASDPCCGDMRIERREPIKALGEDKIEIGVLRVGPAGGSVIGGVSMAAISEAIGYAAALQLILSVWTGGMFGKASRRQLNVVFGSARRRVAFHNFLSYGIIVTAIAHTVIFVIDAIEPNYPWQLGLIWGGLGILCMLGLGVTGALQVPMIRRWNYGTWRWLHLGMSIGAIAFTIVHMLLDGQNFSFIQDALGYKDPLSPPDRV